MPDGLDDFVIDPATGQTVRLPSSVASYIGLPKAAPPPVPTPPPLSGMEQRDAERQGVRDFFSPDAEARRKAAPEYWKSPRGQARLAEMEGRRADMEARNRDFQSLTHGSGLQPAEYIAQVDHPGRPLPGELSRHGALHFAQSEGPIGTIGQIGKPTALDLSPAAAGGYASLDDYNQALADQQAAIPAPAAAGADPNRPEQAGADLQRQGNELNERAAQISGAADQRAAGFEEREIARRNRELDAIRAETQKQEAEKQQRFEELRGNVKKSTDDWANYKIDPGRRWKNASTGRKIGAAIAVAMTALGDALQRKSGPNLALEMIMKSIDDDVNLQVKDREHMGEVATRARGSLDDYRRDYGDWQQARSAKLAEEYKRTADEIERIGASAKTDKAKANALAMVGDLRTRAGALEQGIATSAWTREMKVKEFDEQKRQANQQIGLGYANLKQRGQQFDEEMKFKREELTATRAAKLAEIQAKSEAERAKDLRELGITDPSNKQLLLDHEGSPVIAPTVDEAKKQRQTLKDTQTAISAADELRKIAVELGPQVIKGKAADAFNTKLGLLQLQIKEAYALGALDEGSARYLDKVTGGDPTKVTAASVAGLLGIGNESGDRVAARLSALGDALERRGETMLGNPTVIKTDANGQPMRDKDGKFITGKVFTRLEELKPTAVNTAGQELLKGTPTTAAAVESVEPGWFAKGLQDAESFVFGTKQTYKKDAEAAREGTGNSLKYPGFRAEKEPMLDQLVASAQHGDEQAQKWLIEAAANKKTQDATMTLLESQPGLSDLIPRALEKLPEDKRNIKTAIYAARASHGGPRIQVYPGGGVPVPTQQTAPAVPFGVSPEAWQQFLDRRSVLGD